MKNNETLNQVETNGYAAISNLLEELKQQNKSIAQDANKACENYLADLEKRKNAITKRINSFYDEIDKIENTIKSLQSDFVNATVTSNTETSKAIQKEISDLETQKQALISQIDVLSSAHISGDTELYVEVLTKGELLSEANIQYRENIAKIHELAKLQEEGWHKISEDTVSMFPFGANNPKYEKVLTLHKNMNPTEENSDITPNTRNLETGRYMFGNTEKD